MYGSSREVISAVERFHVHGCESVVEMLQLGGADDGSGDERLGQQPRRRYLRPRNASRCGNLGHAIDLWSASRGDAGGSRLRSVGPATNRYAPRSRPTEYFGRSRRHNQAIVPAGGPPPRTLGHRRGREWSLLRHPRLAQAGEISGVVQRADLRHPQPRTGMRLQAGDARKKISVQRFRASASSAAARSVSPLRAHAAARRL